MEGSALRAGADQDVESSVNSLLGPALGTFCCFTVSRKSTATAAHSLREINSRPAAAINSNHPCIAQPHLCTTCCPCCMQPLQLYTASASLPCSSDICTSPHLDGATCGDNKCPVTQRSTAIMLLLDVLCKCYSLGLQLVTTTKPHADSGLSPLLIEHEPGGSGVHTAPRGRRWQWLPVSPDDSPSQWANADIWEQYPLAGQLPLLKILLFTLFLFPGPFPSHCTQSFSWRCLVTGAAPLHFN